MPGYGPPPSENKRRRNKDTFAEAEVSVPAESQAQAPKLPGASKFSKPVRDWYDTWTKAPQAGAFTVTDWQRLHMLAPLVQQYFEAPTKELMSEIRLNEALLGATHVDRMRGRIKVEAPQPKPAQGAGDGVADLTARRRRISDAS